MAGCWDGQRICRVFNKDGEWVLLDAHIELLSDSLPRLVCKFDSQGQLLVFIHEEVSLDLNTRSSLLALLAGWKNLD